MVSSSSFFPDFKTDRVDPEAAPRLLVGAASPLWLMYGGAAAAGATWWWWASRWREAVNLESTLAPTLELAPTLLPEPEALAVEVVETVEAAVEAVVEPAKIVAEAAIETVVETVAAANDSVVETVEAVAETLEPVALAPVEVAPAVEALAETPVAAVEASIAAAEVIADDLTRLVGIGPKLAVSLADLGVTSFSQIAAWTPEDLASIDQLLNLKGRADRDAWIAQAKRFAGATEA